MTVSQAANGSIVLNGEVLLEDAEPLLRLLIDNPNASVDWRTCVACHTAVLQILLAARRRKIGPPVSDFLRHWMDLD